jgi:hypothetical protein
MDLGLKGSSLATCLSELEHTTSEPDSSGGGVEFSALMILYSRHAGLRVPSSYDPSRQQGKQEDESLWVPTTTGEWVEVSTCTPLQSPKLNYPN